MQRRTHRRIERHDIYDLLRQDHYTPEDLAELLGLDCRVIEQEVFHGDLRAYIVDHQVVSIRREDVVRWLDNRPPNA